MSWLSIDTRFVNYNALVRGYLTSFLWKDFLLSIVCEGNRSFTLRYEYRVGEPFAVCEFRIFLDRFHQNVKNYKFK